MSVEKMQSALAQAYKEALPDVVAIFPNEAATPPDKGIWVNTHFDFNNPVAITCGSDGEDEIAGFAQFSVTGPTGRGEAELMAKVKLILQKFKGGEKFLYAGQEVMVTSAGRGKGYKVDAWWRIPVTVFFIGRYPRNTPT